MSRLTHGEVRVGCDCSLAIQTPEDLTFRELGSFGVEVQGLDISSLDASQSKAVASSLSKHQLLLFRGQTLTPAEQLAFTTVFGRLEDSLARRPASHQHGDSVGVLYLSNEPGSSTSEYGMGWHSDGLAYAKTPHGATVLSCAACPPGVGATLFADQYLAASYLSDAFKEFIRARRWYLPKIPHSEVEPGRRLSQPLLRVHGTTGKEFVFCAPGATEVEGLSEIESSAVLAVIRRVQATSLNVYRHEWKPGDVIVWENCTLLHSREDTVEFSTQGRRAMYRSATAGDFAAIETAEVL